MVHVTLPKIQLRAAPWRSGRESAGSQAAASATRRQSFAAPLTLAAVVVLALVLAIAMAIVTALGA